MVWTMVLVPKNWGMLSWRGALQKVTMTVCPKSAWSENALQGHTLSKDGWIFFLFFFFFSWQWLQYPQIPRTRGHSAVGYSTMAGQPPRVGNVNTARARSLELECPHYSLSLCTECTSLFATAYKNRSHSRLGPHLIAPLSFNHLSLKP